MALSLEQTRHVLSRLGVCPNRKLGQNFLVDARITERSLQWADLSSKDVVIEIGPGCGTLTEGLVKTGATVFAVEKDEAFYRHISETYPIDILHNDALEHPVGRFLLDNTYKIVANLPYAIASVWLATVLNLPRLPDDMILLVQKEAADRWFAKSGSKHFCALGIALQATYELKNTLFVAKKCFYPQPKVDSLLIHAQKKQDGIALSQDFKDFLRTLFLHRRQQIGRLCRETASPYATSFLAYLPTKGLNEKVRAEDIPLDVWLQFYQENLQKSFAPQDSSRAASLVRP